MGYNNHCTAEGFMLRDLTIQNYRCFKDFHIDGLARVNLIVGMNNIGKTSLLEAVYLLINQGNPQCLLGLLEDRGEIVPPTSSTSSRVTLGGSGLLSTRRYQIRHIFQGHQFGFNQTINLQSQKELSLSLKIQLRSVTRQEQSLEDIPDFDMSVEDTSEIDFSLVELYLSYGSDLEMRVPVREDGSLEARSFRLTRQQSQTNPFLLTQPFQFLTTSNQTFDKLATMWDKINLTPEEEKVVAALQILEPDVKRIGFTSRLTSNSGILLKLDKQSDPIPLGSMGEGMRRILSLAMAAVTAENGFLLVDEIETGLYYETQTDMWRLILEVAQQLNVQVFATTHSWDCISAFQEALSQVEDSSVGKLFRLSKRDETIRPVAYTADELAIAVPHSIEVR
jgi:AAA15 family ATPase/GTPase